MSDFKASDFRDKVLHNAPFDVIEPHMRRRTVYVVRNHAIEIVGDAISNDESEKIKGWLEDGTLLRPTVDEVMHWHTNEKKFTVFVVQPFVLIIEEFDA